MFTGIVKGVGRVLERSDRGGDCRLTIETGTVALPGFTVGASVAVNGVCLTAVAVGAERFSADVSLETLAVTNLGRLELGSKVHLEPSLRAGDPLDGHLVSGHVDGLGQVIAVTHAARSLRVVIEVPPALARYIARKGSVAVDGVSLTVNAVRGVAFDVNIVPHTRVQTMIEEYKAGTAVNIEVDVVARYLERMLEGAESGAISLELLRTHGYADKN
jgi:riboflavin synthase